MRGIEAGVLPLEAQEPVAQQGRGGEQHERRGDLHDRQRVARARTRGGACLQAAQRFLHVGPARAERRNLYQAARPAANVTAVANVSARQSSRIGRNT